MVHFYLLYLLYNFSIDCDIFYLLQPCCSVVVFLYCCVLFCSRCMWYKLTSFYRACCGMKVQLVVHLLPFSFLLELLLPALPSFLPDGTGCSFTFYYLLVFLIVHGTWKVHFAAVHSILVVLVHRLLYIFAVFVHRRSFAATWAYMILYKFIFSGTSSFCCRAPLGGTPYTCQFLVQLPVQLPARCWAWYMGFCW